MSEHSEAVYINIRQRWRGAMDSREGPCPKYLLSFAIFFLLLSAVLLLRVAPPVPSRPYVTTIRSKRKALSERRTTAGQPRQGAEVGRRDAIHDELRVAARIARRGSRTTSTRRYEYRTLLYGKGGVVYDQYSTRTRTSTVGRRGYSTVLVAYS